MKANNKTTIFLNATESDDGNSVTNYGINPLNLGGGLPPKAY